MRLYYISFFYFNFLLFLFFILRIDLVFLFLLFLRKTYSIFKESLTEYTFQEFDGLVKESQILDLYENKLYVDFGLDAGLEEFYIQNLYMYYALYDISLDFEAYSGNFTFKWNDYNIEELNINQNNNVNLKKIYMNLYFSNSYFYCNLKNKLVVKGIEDADYYNLYNYKAINRREIEEPLFYEENEKYYYNYLKIIFLRENFYDTFINDNYIKSLNYKSFIDDLKKRILINKYKKSNKRYDNYNYMLKDDYLSLNDNIIQIKKELLINSYLKK